MDDDELVADTVVDALSEFGCSVHHVDDGDAALAALNRDHDFKVILLDLGLPDVDGVQVLHEIRSRSKLPVIIISGRDSEGERVLTLESGADDYVNKPFSPRELLARIRAVLRRIEEIDQDAAETPGDRPFCFRFDRWRFDAEARTLQSENGPCEKLSAGESLVLEVLLRRPGLVLSREFLIEFAQGPDSDSFDRSVDLHIMRIRRKLNALSDGPDPIETVRGAGYRIAVPVESD